jgi:hypothetical protein
MQTPKASRNPVSATAFVHLSVGMRVEYFYRSLGLSRISAYSLYQLAVVVSHDGAYAVSVFYWS